MTILFSRGDLAILTKAGETYHSTCGHLDNGSADMPTQPIVCMVVNDIHTYSNLPFRALRDVIKRQSGKIALPGGVFFTFPWMIEKLK